MRMPLVNNIEVAYPGLVDHKHFYGESKQTIDITKMKLTLQLRSDDVMDASTMKVKAIITEAKSYDVLVNAMVLYPMRFVLDFREETIFYRRCRQIGDGPKVKLQTWFFQVLTRNMADT